MLENVELKPAEVQLWHANADRVGARLDDLASLLSADEIQRAQRFWFESDRRQFTVARGVLRLLLGNCLGREPRRIEFAYTGYGKPFLRDTGRPSLKFNVSHSQGQVLIALAWDRELGVDIERQRPLPDLEALAARYFAPFEQSQLQQLDEIARREGFFTIWSLKEAFLKARGVGLSYPLDAFWVGPLAAIDPLGRCAVQLRDSAEGDSWSLRKVSCPLGFAAALAAAGHDWQLVQRDCWHDPHNQPSRLERS